jgi:phospholipid/cholesterol/gamma-HCH transport system substrate-binding protein
VKGFVHDNRKVLGNDIKLLTGLLERVDREKDAVGIAVQEGSLALGNLAVAFESTTGTYGSRVQVEPGIHFRPDQFLCQTLTNSGPPGSDAVCPIIEAIFAPLLPAISGSSSAKAPEPTAEQPATPTLPELQKTPGGVPDLFDLLGGERP